VIKTVFEGVRVALDVEEEIAARGRRQRRESPFRLVGLARLGSKELVLQTCLAPAFELDACLLADASQGGGRGPLELRLHRQRQGGQGREGADAPPPHGPPAR